MAKIAIILGAMILFIFVIFVFFCACIVAGRSDEDVEREDKDLCNKKQLCPVCKTGKESYDIDKLSETCPYIGSLKNGKCKYFVPFD